MDTVHKKVESYIDANLPGQFLRSFNRRQMLDYTKVGYPLLTEGSEEFCVFTVNLERSNSSSIGYASRRIVGTVFVEVYMNKESSDRDYYRILKPLTNFLEGVSHDGVHYRDTTNTGEYADGRWQVRTVTFNFTTNITRS